MPPRPTLRRWVAAAVAGPAEVTLRFVDAEEGRSLNRDWRGKDYATNVLSFPYETAPMLLGDIAICPEVVAREAAERDTTLAAHYAHLVVHGMLHLQGYDHETGAREARRMEAKEREILARLGYPDPYA